VALKFLRPEVSASDKEKQLFLTEAPYCFFSRPLDVGAIYGIEADADGRTMSAAARYTRPFSSPTDPFDVPDSGSAPGTRNVTLITVTEETTRGYDTAGCPSHALDNPKTVIIS
jgi:hypothetical protein